MSRVKPQPSSTPRDSARRVQHRHDNPASLRALAVASGRDRRPTGFTDVAAKPRAAPGAALTTAAMANEEDFSADAVSSSLARSIPRIKALLAPEIAESVCRVEAIERPATARTGGGPAQQQTVNLPDDFGKS